jgi:glycosyltransferase involved in cell wall biosynthesis
MPLVSCMIPCRNGEPFVESAVRSVLDQEGVDLEVVVVDDGSTDTSRQTVLGIGDKRVKVIDGPRTGLAGVTNAALPHMRGDVFVRNDADDLYPPGRLKFQLDWMTAHPAFAAVCGKFDMITGGGDHVSTVGGPPDGSPDVACDVTDELGRGVTRTHWNAWMFRTDVVRKLGGCRPWFTLGDDLDLMMRFAPHHRVWYEPRVWYQYRLHEGTAAHSMPNNRRVFFEEQAKHFIRQRVATGTDDLEQGKAPPIPEAGAVKPYYAKDQIQDVLIGKAWKEHAGGRKGAAIKTGVKAVATKPANLAAWKSLAALVVKKPR